VRIAYVINGLDWGGAQSRLVAVLDQIRSGGADVEVFALSRRDGRAENVLTDAGYTVHCYRGGAKDHARAAFWLRRALKDFVPTHLWTSLTQATLIGIILAKRMKIPAVHWQHNAFLKPANLSLLRHVRHWADLWVADCESVGKLTQSRLGKSVDNVMIWPLFSADATQPISPTWRPGEVFRFGSLGRLHHHKGYANLIAAAALVEQDRGADMPHFSVDIGGEGPLRSALAALIAQKAGTRVSLRGFQSDPEAFLSDLHCYVQPSLVEGFCIAAHEAMLAGLPIIASPVGELAYSVSEGTSGYLTPLGNPRALADAMLKILADPGRAATMGARGRAMTLDRFGADTFAASGRAVMARLKHAS
jgi:glycosyltransferase involved in cell wall biosynthesis